MRARRGCASAFAIRASEVSPSGRWPLVDEVGAVLGMVSVQTTASTKRMGEGCPYALIFPVNSVRTRTTGHARRRQGTSALVLCVQDGAQAMEVRIVTMFL